ncbi:DUF4180 domain-containing protein [Nonomuraea fuscirosea]|uniref:DUF4180 domain-containing protein n=1 Tax=Nonomuraea fuscirosea TaxID=1291556 RepID=UPI0033C0125A
MTDILRYDPDGRPLSEVRDVLDLIGEAWSTRATWVSVPADRLPGGFFTLSNGVAGEITQKFAQYGIGLAIVGDVSGHAASSSSVRDWIYECNRGRQLWFVRDDEELTTRHATLG